MSEPVIHWFRRDLRLSDNTALHAAISTDKPVIPLFILDTHLLGTERVGTPRLKFLLRALTALDERLKTYNARLIIRRGEPVSMLQDLVEQTGSSEIFFNADYSPYAVQRDKQIQDALEIPVQVHDDVLLMPPGSVMKKDGDPYVVFTPFKNTWNEQTKPGIIDTTLSSSVFYEALDTLKSDGIPSLKDLGHSETIELPPATEEHAHHMLNAFIDADIGAYAETRNKLPINPFADDRPTGTSYLSPYLRLGILSPRQAYWAARSTYKASRSDKKRQSIATWVSELTWREFYVHILYHFPHVLQRDFVDTYLQLDWRDDTEQLQAWKDGQTGYPVIDAPMRQLKAIGWMPNRARMIVASFLTKDLLIHWRHGDIHFMQHLIDGDPAANNGGWQWAAGTGTDAQPYFRIFNPISQSERYATPEYLRHWIPELKDVPDKYIHAPWKMEESPQEYPPPLVDHGEARENTLQAFKAARGE